MKNLPLIHRAMKGDEEAFESLIKNDSEKLYKMAYLYMRDKEDALDVVQETVYKAYISIKQVKQAEFFETWLIRILINTAYAALKKRNKTVPAEDLLQELAAPEKEDIDGKMDLANAIHTLSRDYQTVIILFYYRNLSIKTIAKAMGKPENTIKTYLRRAKIELRNTIGGADCDGQKTV